MELKTIPKELKEKFVKRKNSMQSEIDMVKRLRDDLIGTRKKKSKILELKNKIKFNDIDNPNKNRVQELKKVDENLNNYDNLENLIKLVYERVIQEENNFSESFIKDTLNKLLNGEYKTTELDENEKKIKEKVYNILDNYMDNNNMKYNVDELDPRIIILNKKIGENEVYEDSSEIFRHLRNSIAHGRFRIDYNDFFKRNDFSRIKICFEDVDDKKIAFKTGSPQKVFELTLTVKELISLFDELKEKVNQVLKEKALDEGIEVLEILEHQKNESTEREKYLQEDIKEAKKLLLQYEKQLPTNSRDNSIRINGD